MAAFNVIRECVVEGRHYTRPSTAPIEVDAATAAKLVKAGVLTPVEEAATEAKAAPSRAKRRTEA